MTRVNERGPVLGLHLRALAGALCGAALFGCGAHQRAPSAAPSSVGSIASPVRCAEALGGGLDLVVLGSGGPRSEGRAASSYLVGIAGKPRFLIDVGPGMFARLGESQLVTDQLDTVLLTHLHIDHVGDLAALVKSRDLSGDQPLAMAIFGPSGRGVYPATSVFVDRLFGSAGAYAYLPGFRNELRLTTTDVVTDLDAAPRTLVERDSVRVSSVAVDHADVPALAYRIDFGEHSVVISGDLASKQSGIIALAQDADVLVYDAAVLDPPGSPEKLYDLHTAPARIGEVAQAANVGMVVLSHLPSMVAKHETQVRRSVTSTFEGDVRMAVDCMHIAVGEAR
jgi:ribonuclease BN (tRNA processing enzyme)